MNILISVRFYRSFGNVLLQRHLSDTGLRQCGPRKFWVTGAIPEDFLVLWVDYDSLNMTQNLWVILAWLMF